MRLRPLPPNGRLRGVTLVDFESRSRCNLKKRGGRLYWADPSTEAICAVLYHVETRRYYLWQPGDDVPRLDTAVAHNASNFDRFGGAACGWRVSKGWVDSASAARRAGLPGALDELGKRWLGTEKDKAGSRFTIALSRPSRAKVRKGQLPEITDEARARVVRYCYRDVRIMAKAWGRLAPWLEVDAETCEVDRIVNDRGIQLDQDMVRALQRQLARQQDDAVRVAAKAMGCTAEEARSTAMSPQKLTAYTGLENAQADTVREALKSAPWERQGAPGSAELCAARLALASVVPGKLTAALSRVSPDGRLRDQLAYYGAHAQPLSEPVHTPRGWMTMRDLRVGDWVSGSRGPVRVTGVYPQGVRDVLRVRFSDGAYVRCDAEHLWSVVKNGHRRVMRTCDLGELKQTFRSSNNGNVYRVPLWLPGTDEPRTDLPLDPYTLGAMLGDGCMVGSVPRFTCADPEIVAAFKLPEGVVVKARPIPGKSAVHYALSSGGNRARRNPLRVALEDLGLWGCDSYTKFVPQMYLHADTLSRNELLQGLLDTDGSAVSAGVAKYASCSEALRDAAVQLTRSLGGVARVRTAQLNSKPIYAIECRLPARFPAFRLARKANKHSAQARRNPARSIVSVESDGCEECQCISVDAGDHLYVTRDYVLTHNTGRWSSHGMQVHNLPRVGFGDEAKRIGWECNDYVDALCEGALSDQTLSKKEVAGLLRTCLRAGPGKVLAVLDYSGIEARATVWAANDRKAVDVFRAFDAGTGPDPYRVMAGGYLFGVPPADVTKEQRGLGKVAELMLQYGAGADKFRDSCEDGGADLDALGIEPEEVVRAYREDAHPQIVRLWRACERAFRLACEDQGEGRSFRAGKWAYESRPAADGRGGRYGIDVWCVLPSGRPIVYSNARAERALRKTKDGRTFQAWELSYQGRKAWREHVYGGLLTENEVQGLCSCLLRDALIRCERAGLNPVLHVHDELVIEIDRDAGAEALEEMRAIMSDTPRWARGLPIRLDGFVFHRYRK